MEAALRLAKMWCFDNFAEYLIDRLENLGLKPSRMLELARIHDIRKWYKPALKSLALRKSGLTIEEGRQLGPDLTVICSNLRDLKNTANCSHHPDISDDNKSRKKSVEAAIDINMELKLNELLLEYHCDVREDGRAP